MSDDAARDLGKKAAEEGKELAKDAAAVARAFAGDFSGLWRLFKRWFLRVLKVAVVVGIVFLQLLAAGATANAECGTVGVNDSTSGGTPEYAGGGAAPASASTGKGPTGEDMSLVAQFYAEIKKRYGSNPDGNRVLLATFEAALAESRFNNLDHGDRDSVGVFQQRKGWGTFEERTTPMHALNSFLSKMESERKQNPNILPHQLAQQVQISWCTKRNPPNNSDCHGTWGGNYKDEEQNARNLITGQGGFFAAGGSENGGNSLSPGGTGDIEDVTAAACSGVYGNMDMTGAIPNFQVVNKKDGLTYTLDFLPGGQRGATIKAAITQLGVPYQLNADNWAEHPPDGLLDCSALTKGAVQRGAGIKLTHQSAIQYTEMKKKYGSAQSKALPGDLVFFGDGGPSGIDHVAIYLGSGTIEGQSGKYPIMIAAPKTGDVVKLQKVYKHNNLYGDPGYQDVASDLTLVAGNGAVTSPLKPGSYSYTLPYNKFTAGNHLGIDLIIKRGEPIYAVADGKVIISMCGSPDGCRSFNNTSMTGCGWYVKLYHADGNFNSMYCHMNQRPNVSKGDTVKKGQVLGYIGSTGHSGTPHLHFEIRQPPSKTGSGGTPIDPVPFMQARGVKIG